ncbi:hypothetical protein J9303_06830 [Bacillaceae bacterium Marseille-Q3522]|nr:hypothetical protein [Bacillaceae bacterium Marseille-Q3522]
MVKNNRSVSKKNWLWFLLIIALLLVGIFQWSKPTADPVVETTKAVGNLFQDTGDTNVIKEKLTQEEIDHAIELVNKIDPSDNKEVNAFVSIALLVEINNAQKQLDERDVNKAVDTTDVA